MVYAYDQWAQLPVKDLYDSLLMLASVNAARDMYEKGLLEVKDFKKEYGDFLSPIQKDMDWYSKNVTDKVLNVVNLLYAAGIDPLRSAEGRAAISRVINNIDTGTVSLMKLAAENRKLWDVSYSKLRADGSFNPEFVDWDFARRHNGVKPSEWSTLDNGIWQDTAVPKYMTLLELVHPSFASIKPHALSKEEVESKKYTYNPLYDYEGITRADMEATMGLLMPGIRDNAVFLYHKELARRDLLAENNGIEPTEEEVNKRFIDNAIESDAQIMTPFTYEVNKLALENVRHRHGMAEAKASGDTYINVDGGFNFKDNIYEKGLKNMIGLDPTMFLGTKQDGSYLTMMELADNNPEFFKQYRERVAEAASGSATSRSEGSLYRITNLLTHSKGISSGTLAHYSAQDTIDKYGDNDVTGMNLIRLQPGDLSRIYSASELESELAKSAGVESPSTLMSKYRISKGIKLKRDGKFDHTIVATTNTSGDYGIVTGFVNGRIESFIPIILYRDGDLSSYTKAYYQIDYKSVQSSGDIGEWQNHGISTIYDGTYDTSGQKSSGNVDKWLGVGSSELKSTSVNP